MTTSANDSTASTVATGMATCLCQKLVSILDCSSSNPPPSIEELEDNRSVRSNNSLVLPPRRERRDTDRRGHKKSMEQRHEKVLESVGKKELLIALVVGSSCILGCYLVRCSRYL